VWCTTSRVGIDAQRTSPGRAQRRGDRHRVTLARRVGQPGNVAAAIVYLAGAGFVTGTVLECTGGLNLTAAALAS
jgi:NAD(P)-dependent dehydrogenase (short-subunit alcohol dehydrogenase family)